jgi:hypothetical protein
MLEALRRFVRVIFVQNPLQPKAKSARTGPHGFIQPNYGGDQTTAAALSVDAFQLSNSIVPRAEALSGVPFGRDGMYSN